MRKERIVAEHMAHLRELVLAAIASDGPQCNLNHIDVSKMTGMTGLFKNTNFNGDFSEWDVSNVRMLSIFSLYTFDPSDDIPFFLLVGLPLFIL